MLLLADKHPDVLAEFSAGKFVVHKTSNKFSSIAFDHCHEQNNAIVKDSGGAIGLTTNPVALKRWMVAGPEVSRMITEFEYHATNHKDSNLHLHHDQLVSVQATFAKDVKSLIAAFEELGNPFLEKSQDLLALETRDIKDTSVVEAVRKVETIGKEQYKIYVEERLENCEKPITETIKLALFKTPAKQSSSKQKMQVAPLKNDCSLFLDSSFLVRREMETWIDFLPMKTSQLHHRCRSEAKFDQQPNQTSFNVLI